MAWWTLAGAIGAEVAGTLALRASVDHRAWLAAVVVAYAGSFVLLGRTLRAGLPVGVVYGIWAASGVALVAVLGALLFAETLSGRAVAGIVVIVVGVVLVETGAPRRESGADEDTAP